MPARDIAACLTIQRRTIEIKISAGINLRNAVFIYLMHVHLVDIELERRGGARANNEDGADERRAGKIEKLRETLLSRAHVSLNRCLPGDTIPEIPLRFY
ncbi:MAG TPA: hypothetical protein VNK24_06205 [Elusimicrobiota bacterium]|nr:hypothetical protein [Elusimicrobiota bacterium]